MAWGRTAEVCGEYLTKGSPAFVEGRLQSREWETQEGQKRSTIEVVADNIQFLRGAQKGDQQSPKTAPPAEGLATINLNDEAPAPETDRAGIKEETGAAEEAPF